MNGLIQKPCRVGRVCTFWSLFSKVVLAFLRAASKRLNSSTVSFLWPITSVRRPSYKDRNMRYSTLFAFEVQTSLNSFEHTLSNRLDQKSSKHEKERST